MMLLAIVFRHLSALGSQIFLESGINNEFLAYRMASKFPRELVAIPLLVVMVSSIVHNLIVILSKLAVVLRDRL